jgi:hypothetical protein
MQQKIHISRYATSLYTDHASRDMFLKCHYSIGGAEAVEGQQCFKQLAHSHGIKIKAYRTNNGIMAKMEYMNHIELHEQAMALARVNKHSQNGIAD